MCWSVGRDTGQSQGVAYRVDDHPHLLVVNKRKWRDRDCD
jgi:hypothetical protein